MGSRGREGKNSGTKPSSEGSNSASTRTVGVLPDIELGCSPYCSIARDDGNKRLNFRWRLRGGDIRIETLCPMGPIERGVRALSKESSSFVNRKPQEK